MKSQPVELLMIAGDDVTPAEAAWYSTAKEVTEARLRRVPALLEGLARGDWPQHLPHCYDAETEVFTSDGWKKWPDVTSDTMFAAIDNSFAMHYERADEVIAVPYSGRMYGARSQHIDFSVTPNHRMFVARRTNAGYKPYEAMTSDDIKGKCYRLNTCATDRGGLGGTYDEGWLYGFYLGDGHRATLSRITFHLKKQRKIEALVMNLDALGLTYSIRDSEKGTKTITVMCDDPLFNGRARGKAIDDSTFFKSLDYRRGVFDGLMASDAHNKRGADSFIYTSMSVNLIKGIDRLCATIGKYSKIAWKGGNEAHQVRVLVRSVEPVVNPAQSKEPTDFWSDYDGMVYCASVSTGLLLVRRNGSVMVSGNSVPFEHTLISFRVTSEIATHIHMLKHRIGVSISSQSQRYMELRVDDYYVPEDWPSNLQAVYNAHVAATFDLYHRLIDDMEAAGIDRKRAKESARFVLPYATQIRYRVTFNLLSFVHFQKLRNSEHAQVEIQLIAAEMLRLVKEDGHLTNALAAWEL